MVAHRVKCNICKTFPVTGLRYQCLKCLNFDICQVCFFTGRHRKPHKKSHPVMEHCRPVSAKEKAKLFFRTIRNNLLQGRCKRKEAGRRKALMTMMMGAGDLSSSHPALPSSVPTISSDQPAHLNPFCSDHNCSRPLGEEGQMESHHQLQGVEDTSREILASLKVKLIKTQDSVWTLNSESRDLRKQLNKWTDKVQRLHSGQVDGNRRLEGKMYHLLASQESLMTELQKVKQEIKNIIKCNEESLKESRLRNGPACSLLNPSGIEDREDKSLDPILAFPESERLLNTQSGLFTGNSESPVIAPRTELLPSAQPEADHHQNHGVRSVPPTPEKRYPNQSQSTGPCCLAAQEPPFGEKDMEEQEEKEKEELQELMLKLKDALSFQVQPGQHSALKQELLSAAEHVSKSFSGLITQVSSPDGKRLRVGPAASRPNSP